MSSQPASNENSNIKLTKDQLMQVIGMKPTESIFNMKKKSSYVSIADRGVEVNYPQEDLLTSLTDDQ